jgi:serine/threonine-protein kinase
LATRNRKRILYISILGVLAAFVVLMVSRYVVRAARVEHATEPAPYFPAGAIWTQDISHAPLDPQSSAIISWLADAGGWGVHNRMHVDFSIRVLTADASTPRVRFHKGSTWYSPDSDEVSSIPLPKNGGLEGEDNYRCNGGDCHLIVVDRPEGKLYEAIAADYADGSMSSVFLAVWDLNRVYPPSGRGNQCTSADSAGLPIAPLLFTADELAAGSINHAIRFVLPNERIRAHVFVHPATHAGAPKGPDLAPPIGALFRLKASYDMSQLTPAARVVARGLQKYGMYLSDGGNVALTAQSDLDTNAKYADIGFNSHSMYPLQVSDFEIVKMPPEISLTYDCVRNK